MSRDGLETYGPGAQRLQRLMPLGDPISFARIICDAIEAKKRRIVYPRFYWLVRWFPRISEWLAERFGPRMPRALAPTSPQVGAGETLK
jgi:hypothetical protein